MPPRSPPLPDPALVTKNDILFCWACKTPAPATDNSAAEARMCIFIFVVMVSPFIESLSIILAVQQHLPELSRPHFASYDNPPCATPLERITVVANGRPCRAGSF